MSLDGEHLGLFPGVGRQFILAPAHTPYDAKTGEVNYDAIGPLARYLYNICRFEGIFVTGTNGESLNLGLEERKKVLILSFV